MHGINIVVSLFLAVLPLKTRFCLLAMQYLLSLGDDLSSTRAMEYSTKNHGYACDDE